MERGRMEVQGQHHISDLRLRTSFWKIPRTRSGASLPRYIQVLCVALIALSATATGQDRQHAPHFNLQLSSSDTRLVEAFNWAKQQAMAYVFDGDPVGPWYE